MSIIHLLIANGLSQDCVVDSVISDLPFTHTDSTIGRGDDWSFSGYTDGEDYTYQLTLTTPRTIYIDTCDPYSNYDTIIAIKDTSQCQIDASLQEHDDADQDFCPEGASNINPSWYASLIDSFPLNPGTYYIVVDGYDAEVGNFGIAIGALPEIDTSYIASDDSYIEVVFSDPVYTLASATGGLQINDFEIEFSQNGGNATNVEISNLTNVNGGGLVGGEDTIRINIAVTPGGQSSGVETLSIRPVDRNSIFNSFGIGLSRSSVVIANLTDYYPPIANFIPANDTINPSQDVLIQFNEPIRLINNTNIDNTNIQNLFTLAYADTGTSSIDFVASVDDDDQQFTLNPDVSLDERRTIEVTYAADIFEDFGNNALPANNKVLIVNDITPGVIVEDSLDQNNTFLYLSFNEGVYTNESGTGGLNSSDMEISNFAEGNATTANITGMTSEIGTTLNGGELIVRMSLQFDDIPDGTESVT
ncbi:MAG: Ig-like domain-containing protein, partial [Candidatus Neomarinimicrobiota bacterium]|nr:Ig-like domain-containing protein [Candidatus Neomarinimicrobiota bacterium]